MREHHENKDRKSNDGTNKATGVDMINFESKARAKRNRKSEEKITEREQGSANTIGQNKAEKREAAEDDPVSIETANEDEEGIAKVTKNTRDEVGKREH